MTSILKKIVFSILVLVVTLVVLNLGAALGERLAYGAFWGEDRPQGLYIHQNGQRPKLKPGAVLNGWLYSISINTLGFRGDELLESKPDNGFRIWCMGGSTTFDIFADSNASTWPEQTKRLLQAQFPKMTIEVLNAGVPGETLSGSIEDFERLQSSVQADVVVIYHGPNDMRQLMSNQMGHSTTRNTSTPPVPPNQQPMLGNQGQQGEPPMGQPEHDPWKELEMRIKDWPLVRVALRMLDDDRTIPEAWKDNTLTQKDAQELRRRIEHAIRVIKRNGATPVLATHAMQAQPGDTGETASERVAETAMLLRMTPEHALEAFALYNQIVVQLAKKHQVPLADVRSVVGPEDNLWGDATHFYPPGSLLAAEEFSNHISQLMAAEP